MSKPTKTLSILYYNLLWSELTVVRGRRLEVGEVEGDPRAPDLLCR